jgi:hypothetical protein
MVSDVDLAQPLEIGNTFEVEDAPDQLVGVAHLTNRFFPDFLPEALIARVFAHPRVDEVGREDVVQHRDDLIVTSHGGWPTRFQCRHNKRTGRRAKHREYRSRIVSHGSASAQSAVVG